MDAGGPLWTISGGGGSRIILQRFDFEIPEGTQLTFSPRISLRRKGTVPLRVRLLGQ